MEIGNIKIQKYETFYDLIKEYPIERVKELIYSNKIDKENIKRIIYSSKLSLYDYASLLSPKVEELLDDLIYQAAFVTRVRFGNVIKLYAPLYLSNYCVNSCLYCGFNRKHNIDRRALSLDEISNEIEIIKKRGIDNILLVMGDNFNKFSFDTLLSTVKICKNNFSLINIEVPTLKLDEYNSLKKEGVDGLTIFQETFIEDVYPKYHLAGPKLDYKKRLNTPELACKTGFKFITLGALLGLADFRLELFYLALHTLYLSKKYPNIYLAASFPRIRNADNGFQIPFKIDDRNLLHLISAYRLFFQDNGINISTRENAYIRDILVKLSATIISADSRTDPGGYMKSLKQEVEGGYNNISQFEISDNRSTEEICKSLRDNGLEPLFKYW